VKEVFWNALEFICMCIAVFIFSLAIPFALAGWGFILAAAACLEKKIKATSS